MGQSGSSAKTEASGLKAEYQTYQALFSPDELDELKRIFEKIRQQPQDREGEGSSSQKESVSETFTEYQLKGFLGEKLPDVITARLFNQMWLFQGAFTKPVDAHISYEAFMIIMAKLLKGTMEESSHVICCLAADNSDRLSAAGLAEFVGDILSSYERVLKASDKIGGWQIAAETESKQRFVEFAMQGIDRDDANVVDEAQIQSWLEKKVVFYSLLTDVFQLCFNSGRSITRGISTSSAVSFEDEAETITNDIMYHVPTLPLCQDAPWSKFKTFLDLPSLLTINYHLPHELRRQWRFLYASAVHGFSFSTFLSHIQDQGPSVILVRDTDGQVFGGFASESWHIGPNFVGSAHCFLLTSTPDLGIYESSGHNDHYMYLNIDQQTMPNGLGMGGQLEYFGLWIDQDYGKGHSKAKPTCTTYDSPQLSASADFVIDSLEVWAVGPVPRHKPEDEEEAGATSILDKDAQATALLEIAGKKRYSEGLRDVEKDPTADIPEVHQLPPLSQNKQ